MTPLDFHSAYPESCLKSWAPSPASSDRPLNRVDASKADASIAATKAVASFPRFAAVLGFAGASSTAARPPKAPLAPAGNDEEHKKNSSSAARRMRRAAKHLSAQT